MLLVVPAGHQLVVHVHKHVGDPPQHWSMKHWKDCPTFHRPTGILLNSKNPKGVITAVFCTSGSTPSSRQDRHATGGHSHRQGACGCWTTTAGWRRMKAAGGRSHRQAACWTTPAGCRGMTATGGPAHRQAACGCWTTPAGWRGIMATGGPAHRQAACGCWTTPAGWRGIMATGGPAHRQAACWLKRDDVKTPYSILFITSTYRTVAHRLM